MNKVLCVVCKVRKGKRGYRLGFREITVCNICATVINNWTEFCNNIK